MAKKEYKKNEESAASCAPLVDSTVAKWAHQSQVIPQHGETKIHPPTPSPWSPGTPGSRLSQVHMEGHAQTLLQSSTSSTATCVEGQSTSMSSSSADRQGTPGKNQPPSISASQLDPPGGRNGAGNARRVSHGVFARDDGGSGRLSISPRLRSTMFAIAQCSCAPVCDQYFGSPPHWVHIQYLRRHLVPPEHCVSYYQKEALAGVVRSAGVDVGDAPAKTSSALAPATGGPVHEAKRARLS